MQSTKKPVTSGGTIWRFGGIGIYLYNKYGETEKWREPYFIFKHFSLNFLAWIGGLLLGLQLLTNHSKLFVTAIFVIIGSSVYGWWAEKYFRERESAMEKK